MFDCAADVKAFHDQDVTLPSAERDNMRQRRNANRTRLKAGLIRDGRPLPIEFVSQGSYRMRTMLQDVANDYDIDDGAYFRKEDLVGPRGGEMSALDARWMVRDAVDDGKFKRPPEVRPNCVRVFYDKGYHCDIPVYRRVVTTDAWGQESIHYELAASGGWKRSDARDVSAWYEDERSQSADGTQLRRINRLLKAHARSRQSWRKRILGGFGISVLVVEKFAAYTREDEALYQAMVRIRDRLNYDKVVAHPVTPDDTITSGSEDPQAVMLRDKLSEAITALQPLFSPSCTRAEALACWDKVFNTTFFSERHEEEARSSLAAPAIISSLGLLAQAGAAAAAVSDAGSGRHA
ncbi:MAG TPA: hypothetical protein VEA61_12630 [Allosphingosinicella sp.]|nr:hypothetical protein [Allosphingosinicella sp.]